MKRVELLWAAQLGLCYLCGQPMDPQPHPLQALGWTRDHLHPRSRGGRLSQGNVLLAHLGCNSRRADAEPTPKALSYAVEMARVERALRAMLDASPYGPHLRGSLCALEVLYLSRGVLIDNSEWPTSRLESMRRTRRSTRLKGMQ